MRDAGVVAEGEGVDDLMETSRRVELGETSRVDDGVEELAAVQEFGHDSDVGLALEGGEEGDDARVAAEAAEGEDLPAHVRDVARAPERALRDLLARGQSAGPDVADEHRRAERARAERLHLAVRAAADVVRRLEGGGSRGRLGQTVEDRSGGGDRDGVGRVVGAGIRVVVRSDDQARAAKGETRRPGGEERDARAKQHRGRRGKRARPRKTRGGASAPSQTRARRPNNDRVVASAVLKARNLANNVGERPDLA